MRAVAVIPVILYHADFGPFRGGFVGVDIFFVISGFLITSIIAGELDEGGFSIARFYERRARRILPALYLIMGLSILVAWFQFLPTDLAEFMGSVTSSTVFASNIFFWQNMNYFSVGAKISPLLHTWSLAVEEQFYLIAPLLLVIIWRFGGRWTLAILVALFAASLACAQWTSISAATFAYYMLPTRAWELLMGSIVAIYLRQRGHWTSMPVNQIGSLTGAVLMVASIIWLNRWFAYPSVYTLLPTAGAALVVFCAVPGTIVHKLLGWRPLVAIGLISYSAYLWHQPLFAFARYRSVPEPPATVMAFLICAVFGLAYLSWRFVERPFRDARRISTRRIFGFGASGGVVLAAIGLAGTVQQGFPEREVVRRLALLDYQPDNRRFHEVYWNELRKKSGDPKYSVLFNPFDEKLWFSSPSKRHVLIIGNSHSSDLYGTLTASQKFNRVAEVARFGVQVAWLTPRFFTMPNYRAADVIVIASRYNGDELKKIDWFIERVLKDGKKLVLVKKVHAFPYEGNATLADRMIEEAIANGERDGRALSREINAAYYRDYISSPDRAERLLHNRQIDELGKKFPKIIILDRMDYLCDRSRARCDAVDERLNKYLFDDAHHSHLGKRIFGRKLDRMKWLDPILK